MATLSERLVEARKEQAVNPDAEKWEVSPDDLPTNDQENAAQSVEDLDQPEDNREISPTGSRLIEAAERVNDYLESRAINKAHSEALAENDQRDRESQAIEEGYASYESKVANEEAYRMNENMDLRAAKQQERAERIDAAKDKVRGFGQSTVSHLRRARRVTLDASEAVGNRVQQGIESVNQFAAGVQLKAESSLQDRRFRREYKKEMRAFDKNSARESKLQDKQDRIALKEAAKEDKLFASEMRKKAAIEAKMRRKQEKVHAKAERKQDRQDAKQERIEAAREDARQEAAAALARKAVRREKWTNRKDAVAEKASEIRTKASGKKAAFGKLARRAHSAGKAAHAAGKEAWVNG